MHEEGNSEYKLLTDENWNFHRYTMDLQLCVNLGYSKWKETLNVIEFDDKMLKKSCNDC